TLLGFPGAAPATEGRGPMAPDPSFAVLHGLYWLCANLAARQPVVVIVDDAHWADSSSLRFLAFLLTRLEELCVALLLGTPPREPGAGSVLATITTDATADAIRLAPLTRAAVGTVIQATLGAEADPKFVDACLRATRGLPFLLRALVDGLAEEGVRPDAGA